MSRIIERGEPFFYPGNQVGCLLVHGFTGAPEEMRWLGEHLAEQGYTTLGIRLFGHATHPDDLTRARWQDWMANLEDGYHWIDGACSQVVVIGLSLGAMLTLKFASRATLAGAVAMATLWELPPLAQRLRPIAPTLSKVWRFRTPSEPSDWRDKDAERLNLGYSVQPLRGLSETYDINAEMRSSLKHVECPVTLIYSTGDSTVPTDHAQQIYATLGAQDKTIVRVENSGHLLPRDADREKVFSAITEFVRRVTGDAP
ncbi:MAG: alpha/beta fold hydrolase [Anaerolineales bacterium]|nr:alpha/beta fold hydrolase [Anaerolineales bacterium]